MSSRASCRNGTDCEFVKQGKCNFWHPPCRFEAACKNFPTRECGYYHPRGMFQADVPADVPDHSVACAEREKKSRTSSGQGSEPRPGGVPGPVELQAVRDIAKAEAELEAMKHRLLKAQCDMAEAQFDEE